MASAAGDGGSGSSAELHTFRRLWRGGYYEGDQGDPLALSGYGDLGYGDLGYGDLGYGDLGYGDLGYVSV